jgi:polysaccharide biosynthesis transport protein
VSLDRVDRGLPREAVNRIRSSGAPLLGIVTNAIKPERQGASAYGYGQYGYGKYGYGYGYGGYGYAAYDPAAAYAHYAEAEPEAVDAAGASRQQRRVTAAPKAPSSLRKRVAQRRRQLMRWLDS